MQSINARDLRNDYARVLREVEAGESFTVTNRGRPVAEIAPVGAFSARLGGGGPRDAVPLSEVVGALHFMGPGKAMELRREVDETLDTDARDPFPSSERSSSEQSRSKKPSGESPGESRGEPRRRSRRAGR
ncbi:type II toxin-antitoxin system prevent-host-death family antitoxin [Kineococcus sp. NBC_00420]|uniref:type II toxin-antitoxin system Phd/YefM family antitoxin n=1 Tax=unclassified Kineococcus TaxID=2621656 RepID=UPI002E218142